MKRRKKTYRRRAVARAPRRTARRRRSYRRNPFAGLAAANPPRRRRRTAARRSRRTYRRNPGGSRTFAGLKLTDILYGGSAVIVAPFVENNIRPLLPASMAGQSAGRWLVKIGSAAVVWQGWKWIFGNHIGEVAALVLGSNLVGDAASEFMPSLTSGMSGLGFYSRGGLRAYSPRGPRTGGLGMISPGAISRRGGPSMLPGNPARFATQGSSILDPKM